MLACALIVIVIVFRMKQMNERMYPIETNEHFK